MKTFKIIYTALLVLITSCTIDDNCKECQTQYINGIDGRDGKDGVDGEDSNSCIEIQKKEFVLDFEIFDEGEIIIRYGIANTIYGHSNGLDGNNAMIHNSNRNPASGDDDDLNLYSGNILINSEDGDSTDPDDNAKGGLFEFGFSEIIQTQSIDIIDIEKEGGYIIAYDINNKVTFFDIPITGDKKMQTLSITTENTVGLEVYLVGSGAIDNIKGSYETLVNNCE